MDIRAWLLCFDAMDQDNTIGTHLRQPGVKAVEQVIAGQRPTDLQEIDTAIRDAVEGIQEACTTQGRKRAVKRVMIRAQRVEMSDACRLPFVAVLKAECVAFRLEVESTDSLEEAAIGI